MFDIVVKIFRSMSFADSEQTVSSLRKRSSLFNFRHKDSLIEIEIYELGQMDAACYTPEGISMVTLADLMDIMVPEDRKIMMFNIDLFKMLYYDNGI